MLSFLVGLAVEKQQPLCQGDCNNEFCQGILPPDKITIVRPTSDNPETDPQEYWFLLHMLYGLCWSPRDWYDNINSLLLSIGLKPLLEDPCICSGFSTNPLEPSGTKSKYPVSLGLYVNELFTSWWINELNLSSVDFWWRDAKLTSWGL